MKAKKRLNRGKGLVYLMFFIFVYATVWAQEPKPRAYVGSDACQDCHETEYENFQTYAKKDMPPYRYKAEAVVTLGQTHPI